MANGPVTFDGFQNFSSQIPGAAFPFANLPQQLFASFNAPPTDSYGRWNGTGVSQFLGYPSGTNANPGPTNGYPQGSQTVGTPGPGAAGVPNAAGAPTNGGALPIPNFPAFGPGQSPFTPGLPNVAPAGVAPSGAVQPGITPPPSVGNGTAGNQLKSATQSFSNGGGLPLDPNMPMNPAAQWFAQQYARLNPQMNYSVDSFNNAVKAGRTDLAYMQLAQGGQAFRDAVQKANGWDNGQMNSVINSYGLYGNDGGGQGMTGMAAQYNPANISALLGLGATRNLGIG